MFSGTTRCVLISPGARSVATDILVAVARADRSLMRLARLLAIAMAMVPAAHSAAFAEESAPCRFICGLEWKLEPTFTIENLANRHRVITPDGVIERAARQRVFESVLALDLKTKVP